MLSVMTVVLMPSRTSSHAVSRAPCRNGRVSSAKTAILLPCSTAAADDAERRAVAGRRERAGVAVRQHARAVGHHVGAESRPSRGSSPRLRRGSPAPRDRAASAISSADSPGLRALGERALHPVDRPEQVDRGRPRRRHQVAGLLELDRELLRALGRAAPHPERDAHRGRDADRRRAANDHRPDRLRDFRRRPAAHVDFLGGQLALIDHDDDVVLAIDGREHAIILLGTRSQQSRVERQRQQIPTAAARRFTSTRFARMTSMSPQYSHRS